MMLKTIMCNKHTKLLAALLACVLVVGLLWVALPVNAEEINDKNPDLELITINSNAERDIDNESIYNPKSEFSQKNGKYQLKTNAYVCWGLEDDIAFAYKKYNVKQSGDDYLNASVTIDGLADGTNGQLNHNASIGLMIRSGLDKNSAYVFIHVRRNLILAVYRNKQGKTSGVQYTQVNVSFPCEISLSMKGNTVKLKYKAKGYKGWSSFNYPIGFECSKGVYVGLAAHSCDEKNYIVGNFSRLTIDGIGTYVPGADEDTSSNQTVSEYVKEDPPATDKTKYRETFSSGTFDGLGENVEGAIKNIDGNRVWDKTFKDSQNFFGDKKLTDYNFSARLFFTKDCNPDTKAASNTVNLHVRHSDIAYYGVCDYIVSIRNGFMVDIFKRSWAADDHTNISNGGKTVCVKTINLREKLNDADYSCLGDDKWHDFSVDVVDDTLTVYWDGKKLADYTDDGSIPLSSMKHTFSMGNVGISTTEVAVYIDDLTVTEIEDLFGGDYDNKIGGNYNNEQPQWIKDWYEKYDNN